MAGFPVEAARSDLGRRTRSYRAAYTGPVIDTHLHLDPPRDGTISEPTLEQIIQSIAYAGVKAVVVMPVPNEGTMRWASIGAQQRIALLELAREATSVRLFCGSEYISNWLDRIYREGYETAELDKVLGRLAKDLEGTDYSGVGEIGLYHFNKSGDQKVIQYAPTFLPFLKIIGLAAERGAWVDLHAEPVDPDGISYESQVFGGLELLLKTFPNLKLILSHTAMTNPTNARRILETYPNVMVNFKPMTQHQMWRNLEPITDGEGRLYEDWAELFEAMPARFMVGTDEKFGRQGRHGSSSSQYGSAVQLMRELLGCIEPEAADAIAYRNAERIFK